MDVAREPSLFSDITSFPALQTFSPLVDNQRSSMNSTYPTYVLITPARNEAAFIEMTIGSVIQQSIKPLKWVIVSDGSTDGTDDIVLKYAARHDWIELVRLPDRKARNFAGKVTAFNAGYERVKHLTYDIIGSLDADISFDPEYFGFLVEKFVHNPKLGVAGTPFREGKSQYDYRFSSIDHVSGACQLFRRQCFEAIGGYIPIQGGGIDVVAVVTARMNGWQTRSFPEKVCLHHREMGSGNHAGLNLPFKWGQKDYRLGGHPVWQLFRCVYQMKNKPYVLGGILCLAGYYLAMLSRQPRSASREFVEFRSKEQLQRLASFFKRQLVLAH